MIFVFFLQWNRPLEILYDQLIQRDKYEENNLRLTSFSLHSFAQVRQGFDSESVGETDRDKAGDQSGDPKLSLLKTFLLS